MDLTANDHYPIPNWNCQSPLGGPRAGAMVRALSENVNWLWIPGRLSDELAGFYASGFSSEKLTTYYEIYSPGLHRIPIKPTIIVSPEHSFQIPQCGGRGADPCLKDCQATVERQSPRLTAASSSSHLGFENRVDTSCPKGLSVSIRQFALLYSISGGLSFLRRKTRYTVLHTEYFIRCTIYTFWMG
jgi:hypothetical protein